MKYKIFKLLSIICLSMVPVFFTLAVFCAARINLVSAFHPFDYIQLAFASYFAYFAFNQFKKKYKDE